MLVQRVRSARRADIHLAGSLGGGDGFRRESDLREGIHRSLRLVAAHSLKRVEAVHQLECTPLHRVEHTLLLSRIRRVRVLALPRRTHHQATPQLAHRVRAESDGDQLEDLSLYFRIEVDQLEVAATQAALTCVTDVEQAGAVSSAVCGQLRVAARSGAQRKVRGLWWPLTEEALGGAVEGDELEGWLGTHLLENFLERVEGALLQPEHHQEGHRRSGKGQGRAMEGHGARSQELRACSQMFS